MSETGRTMTPKGPVTEYIVFKARTANGAIAEGGWDHIGPATIAASSADAAVRKVVGNLVKDMQAGTFVAVPLRSFKPVQVSAVQTTVLKLDPQ